MSLRTADRLAAEVSERAEYRQIGLKEMREFAESGSDLWQRLEDKFHDSKPSQCDAESPVLSTAAA